jgi:hypothetical protein
MDELDLVRLARPLAPEPDLTRLRVASLGGSSAAPPVEPPPVEVPLVAIMPAPRHRR